MMETRDSVTDIIMSQQEYPDTDQIEPDRARYLFEKHCAILIVENLPLGSEFGIDMVAYRIGEKFKGVKLIPPGVHFVYASSVDKNTYQCGPRCGFFHDFKVREILIKKWSILEEDFDDSYCPTNEKRQCYEINLRDLDQYLGAYRFSTYKTYLNLTNKITSDIVDDLMPDCKRIRSVPYLTRDGASVSRAPTTRRGDNTEGYSRPAEDNLLPDLQPDRATVINFTKIPSDHIDSNQAISHDKITQYNLDTTMKLEHTFNGDSGRHRLLAEFQFAFTTFLLCHVYDCFEQWKKLLKIICLADSGLNSFPAFYKEFCQILRHQMDHVPEDLFEDIVDSNNIVRSLLDTFFQNVEDCSNAKNLLEQLVSELRKHLEEKFGWHFEIEREDEQPVVVEI